MSGHARPRPAIWVAGFIALLLFAGFCALGVWQVERRVWKLDLIRQVAARSPHRSRRPAWRTGRRSRRAAMRIAVSG
jgi:surfeit locus 1 family protein